MMSEVFDNSDAFRQALESKAFRRWLSELNEFELWGEACVEQPTLNQQRGVRTMTQHDDSKRRTVHDALDKWKFKDSRMRMFAAAHTINVDDVLSCAKEIITSTNATPHDKSAAADIVAIIHDYTISDDED
jgi:hypothetical protein